MCIIGSDYVYIITGSASANCAENLVGHKTKLVGNVPQCAPPWLHHCSPDPERLKKDSRDARKSKR